MSEWHDARFGAPWLLRPSSVGKLRGTIQDRVYRVKFLPSKRRKQHRLNMVELLGL
jgi:hypothetical protein